MFLPTIFAVSNFWIFLGLISIINSIYIIN